MRVTPVFLLTSLAASAQVASIGVKGGVPITDAFNTLRGDRASYATNTKRYVVGPTFELHGPLGLSFEADALYRRLGFEYTQNLVDGTLNTRTVANSWQFPLLAKWALGPGPLKPYVEAGMTLQHITSVSQFRETIFVPFRRTTEATNNPEELHNDNTVGFTFGGGLVLKAGRLRISPGLRYTRWGADSFRDPLASLLRTNRNQGDFLLGITF